MIGVPERNHFTLEIRMSWLSSFIIHCYVISMKNMPWTFIRVPYSVDQYGLKLEFELNHNICHDMFCVYDM